MPLLDLRRQYDGIRDDVLQPVFSYLGLKAGDLPVVEQAAREVLALPMFPELTEAELKLAVESIAAFYS